MNCEKIIFILFPITRTIAQKIEWGKIINAEAAVPFNKICLMEDILPKCAYINVYISGQSINT
jgi:hypothetical protein